MRVLIIGASGYLGKVLYAKCKASPAMSVCGTYCHNPQDDMLYFNIFDETTIRSIIDLFDPNVIVWCLYDIEQEIEVSDRGLRYLLSHLKPNVRFIYVSSTLSPREGQNEETPSEPRQTDMYLANYINGKILGEEIIKNHKNHVIIRPGQIYGLGVNGEIDTRMRRIQKEINENARMVRSANSYISVVHVEDLSSCIIELFDKNFTGTLCVASDKAVSYYEFYQYLAGQIGIASEKIQPEYDYTLSNYFNTEKAQALLNTKIRNLSRDGSV
jgi:dTDP-4-dehydrorhamnose reductase